MSDLIAGDTSTTYTLAIGASSSLGAIEFLGDTDWWRVNLVLGYQYQVWIEGYSSSGGTLVDPYLAIYNSVGAIQSFNNNSSISTYDSYLTFIPPGTGTFYLSAEEYGNNATGTYKITIWQDQLASTSTAASLAVNAISVAEHLGWQGDISDWSSVSLTAGTQYQFDLIGSTGDGTLAGLTLADPYLVLRNSAGTVQVGNDDSGDGLNARIFYTPTTSGTYYLDAQESGNNASGIYRVIVNSTPISGALTLGTAQAGTVDSTGDIDLYSVTLTAGVTYGFSLDGSTLVDPYLEIQDSTGSTVASADDGGSGLNSYLTYTPSSSGTYYLAARESGNNATGNYSARAWQLPSISISNATVTEPQSGTANLVFTISLSAPSPIDVSFSIYTSGTATATASLDYIATSQVLTIPAGNLSTSYSVSVLHDLVFEPTEALHVLLSAPTGGVLGEANAYGLIFDNNKPYVLPQDPSVTYEWYLYPLTGINVFPVWSEYTGKGVRVAVFDQGIDPTHPDLDGNLLISLGRNASNLSAGGAPVLSTDNHGTMVAGTIAAELNGQGIVGVAYGANLVSIYSPLTFSAIASSSQNAYFYAKSFDVLNDSWGFANGFASGSTWSFYDNFQAATFHAAGIALADLAATGRNGLCTVVVQAAGNSFGVGDDTNLHNFQNSQYIITVAATDYAGNVTSYSSPGASVLLGIA